MESLKRSREPNSLSPRDSERESPDKHTKYCHNESIALDLTAKPVCADISVSDCVSPPNKEDSPNINEIETPVPVKADWKQCWWADSNNLVETVPVSAVTPCEENYSPNTEDHSLIDQNEYALNLVKEEIPHENIAVSVAEVEIEKVDGSHSDIENDSRNIAVRDGDVQNSVDGTAVSEEGANKHPLDGSDDPSELNLTPLSPVNQTLKKETDDEMEVINESVGVVDRGESLADSVIDVENETFVDLTGDDDNSVDDDDEIKIVSVEEPIRYLGSENRLPKKRRKQHRRSLLFDSEIIINEDESHSNDSNVPGTSTSTRGRVRSPVLFRDLLDSTISIDDISDISSTEATPMSALARRIRGFQSQISKPSLEQQVLSDLSDNPHFDEINQDLGDYAQSLRQASRTMYDIQGQEHTDTSTTNSTSSTAGLLLKHMFFPPARFATGGVSSGGASRCNQPQYTPSHIDLSRTPQDNVYSSSHSTYNPLVEEVSTREGVPAPTMFGYHERTLPVVPETPDVIMTDVSATSVQPSTSATAKPQMAELACPICFEPLSELKKIGRNMCSTICGHMFCKVCLEESLRQCKQCPTCRKKLSKKQYHNIYLNFV